MEEEFSRFKNDYEQLKLQKQEQANEEIMQLRQTNDVSPLSPHPSLRKASFSSN